MSAERFSSERRFFVYHVYGLDQRPLYVGYTGNPKQRWRGHRQERPGLVAAAVRFFVQGPYTEVVARRIEREQIAAERPIFNAETYCLDAAVRSEVIQLNADARAQRVMASA